MMDLFKSDEELEHELKGIESKLEEKRDEIIYHMYTKESFTLCYPATENHNAEMIDDISSDKFKVMEDHEATLWKIKSRHKSILNKEKIVDLLNEIKQLEDRAEEIHDILAKRKL